MSDASDNPTNDEREITRTLALPFEEREVKFKPQAVKNNRRQQSARLGTFRGGASREGM